jgi:hypothetical protein
MREFNTPQPNTPKNLHNKTNVLNLRISPHERQAPLLVNRIIYQYNINLKYLLHTKSKVGLFS